MKQPCKCGRSWEARWISQHAYRPVCAPCGKTPSKCTCPPLEDKAPAVLDAIADVVLAYRPKSKRKKPRKRKKAKRERARRL
jgi:hypothetical protein